MAIEALLVIVSEWFVGQRATRHWRDASIVIDQRPDIAMKCLG